MVLFENESNVSLLFSLQLAAFSFKITSSFSKHPRNEKTLKLETAIITFLALIESNIWSKINGITHLKTKTKVLHNCETTLH